MSSRLNVRVENRAYLGFSNCSNTSEQKMLQKIRRCRSKSKQNSFEEQRGCCGVNEDEHFISNRRDYLSINSNPTSSSKNNENSWLEESANLNKITNNDFVDGNIHHFVDKHSFVDENKQTFFDVNVNNQHGEQFVNTKQINSIFPAVGVNEDVKIEECYANVLNSTENQVEFKQLEFVSKEKVNGEVSFSSSENSYRKLFENATLFSTSSQIWEENAPEHQFKPPFSVKKKHQNKKWTSKVNFKNINIKSSDQIGNSDKNQSDNPGQSKKASQKNSFKNTNTTDVKDFHSSVFEQSYDLNNSKCKNIRDDIFFGDLKDKEARENLSDLSSSENEKTKNSMFVTTNAVNRNYRDDKFLFCESGIESKDMIVQQSKRKTSKLIDSAIGKHGDFYGELVISASFNKDNDNDFQPGDQCSKPQNMETSNNNVNNEDFSDLLDDKFTPFYEGGENIQLETNEKGNTGHHPNIKLQISEKVNVKYQDGFQKIELITCDEANDKYKTKGNEHSKAGFQRIQSKTIEKANDTLQVKTIENNQSRRLDESFEIKEVFQMMGNVNDENETIQNNLNQNQKFSVMPNKTDDYKFEIKTQDNRCFDFYKSKSQNVHHSKNFNRKEYFDFGGTRNESNSFFQKGESDFGVNFNKSTPNLFDQSQLIPTKKNGCYGTFEDNPGIGFRRNHVAFANDLDRFDSLLMSGSPIIQTRYFDAKINQMSLNNKKNLNRSYDKLNEIDSINQHNNSNRKLLPTYSFSQQNNSLGNFDQLSQSENVSAGPQNILKKTERKFLIGDKKTDLINQDKIFEDIFQIQDKPKNMFPRATDHVSNQQLNKNTPKTLINLLDYKCLSKNDVFHKEKEHQRKILDVKITDLNKNIKEINSPLIDLSKIKKSKNIANEINTNKRTEKVSKENQPMKHFFMKTVNKHKLKSNQNKPNLDVSDKCVTRPSKNVNENRLKYLDSLTRESNYNEKTLTFSTQQNPNFNKRSLKDVDIFKRVPVSCPEKTSKHIRGISTDVKAKGQNEKLCLSETNVKKDWFPNKIDLSPVIIPCSYVFQPKEHETNFLLNRSTNSGCSDAKYQSLGKTVIFANQANAVLDKTESRNVNESVDKTKIRLERDVHELVDKTDSSSILVKTSNEQTLTKSSIEEKLVHPNTQKLNGKEFEKSSLEEGGNKISDLQIQDMEIEDFDNDVIFICSDHKEESQGNLLANEMVFVGNELKNISRNGKTIIFNEKDSRNNSQRKNDSEKNVQNKPLLIVNETGPLNVKENRLQLDIDWFDLINNRFEEVDVNLNLNIDKIIENLEVSEESEDKFNNKSDNFYTTSVQNNVNEINIINNSNVSQKCSQKNGSKAKTGEHLGIAERQVLEVSLEVDFDKTQRFSQKSEQLSQKSNVFKIDNRELNINIKNVNANRRVLRDRKGKSKIFDKPELEISLQMDVDESKDDTLKKSKRFDKHDKKKDKYLNRVISKNIDESRDNNSIQGESSGEKLFSTLLKEITEMGTKRNTYSKQKKKTAETSQSPEKSKQKKSTSKTFLSQEKSKQKKNLPRKIKAFILQRNTPKSKKGSKENDLNNANLNRPNNRNKTAFSSKVQSDSKSKVVKESRSKSQSSGKQVTVISNIQIAKGTNQPKAKPTGITKQNHDNSQNESAGDNKVVFKNILYGQNATFKSKLKTSGVSNKSKTIKHNDSNISDLLSKAEQYLEAAISLSQNTKPDLNSTEQSLKDILSDCKGELKKLNDTINSIDDGKSGRGKNAKANRKNTVNTKKSRKSESTRNKSSVKKDKALNFSQPTRNKSSEKEAVNSAIDEDMLFLDNLQKSRLSMFFESSASKFKKPADFNAQSQKFGTSSQNLKNSQTPQSPDFLDDDDLFPPSQFSQKRNINASQILQRNPKCLSNDDADSQKFKRKSSLEYQHQNKLMRTESFFSYSELLNSSSQQYLQELSTTIASENFNECSIDFPQIFEDVDAFLLNIQLNPELFSDPTTPFEVDVIKTNTPPPSPSFQTGSSKILSQALKRIVEDESLVCGKDPANSAPEKIDVLIKITAVLEKLGDDLRNGRKVSVVLPRYGCWKNVVFVDNVLSCKRGGTTTRICKDHKNSMRKFRVVVYLLMKIYTLLMSGSVCTKREIYYQILSYVNNQVQVNGAYNDVCCLLDTPPWFLGIMPSSRGMVYGNLKLVINKTSINCNIKGGIMVPQDINSMRRIETNAKFILIVEKEAVFQKILDEDIQNKLTQPFILLTGKGYPDTNTRLLAKKLSVHLKLPMFILVDADPFGIEIMLSYRFGTLSTSFLSRELALPHLRWIGIHPSEIEVLNIDNFKLTARDKSKIDSMLKRPYMDAYPKIRWQLHYMKMTNAKAEIEGVIKCSHSLSNFYIPNKLCTLDFY